MEDLDAATVTDIREFAKPNCAKGASNMMRRGVLVRLLVNRVALRPIRGEMFIESATSKNFFLAPAERNIVWSPRTNDGNIALRWSASYRVRSTIYKHLAPLERKLIPLLHLKVEFTLNKIR
jgi:hypothetical protein